jgi:hypothetical protein
MKTLEECAKILKLTTKGVLYRLNKLDITPVISLNNKLEISDIEFEKINYPNHNIKEIVYITQTYHIYESKMNYE